MAVYLEKPYYRPHALSCLPSRNYQFLPWMEAETPVPGVISIFPPALVYGSLGYDNEYLKMDIS